MSGGGGVGVGVNKPRDGSHKSLASRAPGRNSGELPALECALGAFSANGMWGRGHCTWDCFPLVVDQQRFRLLNTGSESLRFYQSWVWQSRSISLANSRGPGTGSSIQDPRTSRRQTHYFTECRDSTSPGVETRCCPTPGIV